MSKLLVRSTISNNGIIPLGNYILLYNDMLSLAVYKESLWQKVKFTCPFRKCLISCDNTEC